jgi:hypothetical protein
MRRLGCLLGGLLLAGLAGAQASAASGVAPTPPPCEPLGSSARREPLSQLLRELSAVRRFRLENQISDDPVIAHTGGNDVALMTAISRQVNLMVRYAASKDCPGQWRVDAIWILPGLPDPVTPPTANPVPPPPSEADLAAAKKATALYMQAHGLQPVEAPADPASAAPR